MGVIRDAATAAAALAQQQADLAHQEACNDLVAEARAAVEALPAPDGSTPLANKLKDDEFSVQHLDLERRMVVLSDGDLTLGRFRDDIHVVVLKDGKWTQASAPITTLAQLGEALTGSSQ